MTRAIPRFLGGVPLHDAFEMRAHGRALVQGTVVVSISGDLLRPATHETAFAARNFGLRSDLAARHAILCVAECDVDVLLGCLEERPNAERNALRIVNRRPEVIATRYEIGEQHASDGAVRHALTGITRSHVHVL